MKKNILLTFSFVLFLSNAVTAKEIQWRQIGELEWSDVLPAFYSNCIPERDEKGQIILSGEIKRFVSCKIGTREAEFLTFTYTDYFYEGTLINDDESKIVDSAAIRACRSIGGRLPSMNDFNTLNISRKDENFPSDFEKQLMSRRVIWSSNVSGVSSITDGLVYLGDQHSSNNLGRYVTGSVTCVR